MANEEEIPIVWTRNQQTGEYRFPKTHVDGVIGLEEFVEQIIKNFLDRDLILQAPTGQKFKITVNAEGELNTERLEE